VSLELGGHCPAIVCADADLDLTAEAIAYKAFRNMGQSCSSINRIYVHAAVHDALVERLVAHARKQRIGDGIADGSVDLGPMATAEALRKVQEHVADAVALGARVAFGGAAPDGAAFARGHFYLPTVLTGLTPGMRMAREETFGPVAPVAAYTDLNDAIRLANDTAYGLVSYIFSRDTGGAMQLAELLEAGTVCINHVAVNTAAGPYQGWKDSGFGVELGRDAMLEYLDVQHVKVRNG
jgi:acyl-CoA reductase-like NAD-dependent aldehyde dehydrogenase